MTTPPTRGGVVVGPEGDQSQGNAAPRQTSTYKADPTWQRAHRVLVDPGPGNATAQMQRRFAAIYLLRDIELHYSHGEPMPTPEQVDQAIGPEPIEPDLGEWLRAELQQHRNALARNLETLPGLIADGIFTAEQGRRSLNGLESNIADVDRRIAELDDFRGVRS